MEPDPAPHIPLRPGHATPLDPRGVELARLSPYQALFERRVLFLRGALEETTADDLVAQLLTLEGDGDAPVTLYIDSPGGSMTGMFALYDAMTLMRAPVDTVAVGLAASAGAFLLATGTGTRSATPNVRIMIHQPSGGAQGTSADIQIQARQIAFLRERMEQILAERTGQTVERVARDMHRDHWLSATQARDYGLVDQVAARP